MNAMTTWNREMIQALLAEHDNAVTRGLEVIHSLQTADERTTRSTMHSNRVGWSGYDARIMSSLAEFYEKRGYLSAKQLTLARRKMMRYAGQLARVANGKVA